MEYIILHLKMAHKGILHVLILIEFIKTIIPYKKCICSINNHSQKEHTFRIFIPIFI
ncbi:hypothetical protein [Methanobrevibacter ruminantium]|uniref:hypothetical protein n=1 Tax=Methanobrevibacter ruminantium TaxID=83816 RepID=UPI001494A16F|nr:hypothetical protein [Methanobrevibacter ruminantium]